MCCGTFHHSLVVAPSRCACGDVLDRCDRLFRPDPFFFFFFFDLLTCVLPQGAYAKQLNDLYSVLGDGMRRIPTRTIVIGKKRRLVESLLVVLTYFIRCSDVLARMEGTHAVLFFFFFFFFFVVSFAFPLLHATAFRDYLLFAPCTPPRLDIVEWPIDVAHNSGRASPSGRHCMQ